MMRTHQIPKTVLLVFVFLFLLTSCGKEKPPVDYNSNNNNQNTETIDETDYSGYNGNSKPIDEYPCEGIHVMADENAFWQDTTISFKPVDETTEGIEDLEDRFYQDGFMMLSGFEVDAGLADDEFIPGQYDVEYDLSTTDIDPELYANLAVYRVGDDGSIYRLATILEGNILKFSSNQNSLFITGCLLVTLGYAAYNEYYERNQYYLDNKMEVFTYEGKNPYLDYYIEWNVQDIEKKDLRKELDKRRIEDKYEEEAKQYRSTLNFFERLKSNNSIAAYTKKKLDADEKYQKLKKEVAAPDLIVYTAQCIDTASKYLAEVEKMRMPLHTVPFKNVNDGEAAYGSAVNRTLSTSYIEIRLKMIDVKNKSDYYNFLLTITHELLHICQNRYRLPVDFITDSTRYDEMVALVTEIKAKDYYKNNGIIPADADPQITDINHWGCMRLPIDGSGDSAVDKKNRNDALINAGYCTGDFLQYLFNKTGKRPNANVLMYARDAHKKTPIVKPIRTVLSISENEFDIHFRNWLMSHRYDVGEFYYSLLYGKDKKSKYPLSEPQEVTKGKKYHIDFIHDDSYFLNIRGFRQSKNEQTKAVVVPDSNLRDVFPSSNVVPGITYNNINAGAFIEDFKVCADEKRYLPILEVEGDNSSVKAGENAGYTVYILDQTPKVALKISDEKLEIKLPEPEEVCKDGVCDGYILKISTDNDQKTEREIPKDNFGKTLELNKSVLFNGDTSKAVTVTVTITEFFSDAEGKKHQGFESDPVRLKVEGVEETKPEPKPDYHEPLPDVYVDASDSLPLSYDSFSGFNMPYDQDYIKSTTAVPNGNNYVIDGENITFNLPDAYFMLEFASEFETGSRGTMAYSRNGVQLKGRISGKNDYSISGSIDSISNGITGIYELNSHYTDSGKTHTTYRIEETSMQKINPSSSWFEISLSNGKATKVRIDLMGTYTVHILEKSDDKTIIDSTNDFDRGLSIRLVD